MGESEIQTEYDLIAIGGGLAGLATAVAAADHGLSALVVEKTDLLGGVTAYSNGQLWAAANHLELEAGIADSPAAGLRYLTRLGLGQGNAELARSYAALAPRAIAYFERVAGVRWQLVDGLADYYYPDFEDALPNGRYLEVAPLPGADMGDGRSRLRTSPQVAYRLTSQDIWTLGGAAASHRWDPAYLAERERADLLASGTGLAAYFVRALADATVLTGATVDHLILDGIRVAGAQLRAGDASHTVRARRGVLLATGGYDYNPELATAFEGHQNIHSAAPPAITGDHLALALPAGATVTQAPKPIRLGYPAVGVEDDGHPVWRILGSMAFPHAILVNRDGARFADESFYPSIGHAVRAIDGRAQRFRNWPCWAIFDDQYRERYTFGSVAPGAAFPPGWGIAQADSLDKLAAAAGIDPDGLKREVGRFNEFCGTGVDRDFSRGERPWARTWYGDTQKAGNPNLGSIERPPFYAYSPGLVGTGIASFGLITNRDGAVLGHDLRPVPGLYAAGNSVAVVESGAGYQSGVANTRSLVFAWTAVRHAAGDPVSPAELTPAG